MLGRCYKYVLGVTLISIPSLVSAQVYINEIMYDLSGGDSGREWIEVYNSGSSAIDLSAWKFFENNTNHSLNNISGGTSLSAGGYAIIADVTTKFLLDWPSFSGILFDSTFSLNNTGETLSLKDSTQTVIDTVTYNSSTGANGDGNSLQKSGSSWIAAAPTPGLANSSNSSGSSSTSTATTTNQSTENNEVDSNESGSSVHYNATSLSNKKPEAASIVSAGRDRLGTVGSPLEFRAETNFEYTGSTIFKWNFGNGSEGVGTVLNHVYEYPGEYTVVLNALLPEGQAVSRFNVKIVEPDIAITAATPERIELKNNSKHELSLFGRVLVVGEKYFAFPQDTIIRAGQSISFSNKVTGLHPTNLADASIFVVGDTERAKIAARIREEKSRQIESIKREISILQNQLATMPRNPHSNLSQDTLESLEEVNELPERNTQTAAAIKTGWFDTFKRFFLRTK